MRPSSSLPPGYFEQMFAGDPDPWDLQTSRYEAAKFDASIAALGSRFYQRGLEIGCATGVLTQLMARRCKTLLAVDVSDTALDRARTRNADSPHVNFETMVFPSQTPDGDFDLIVLSEVVYYWDIADIAAAGAWIARHLDAGGDLLLVHWIGDTDYPQAGDDAVGLMGAALRPMTIRVAGRTNSYRLDLWRKP